MRKFRRQTQNGLKDFGRDFQESVERVELIEIQLTSDILSDAEAIVRNTETDEFYILSRVQIRYSS